MLFLLLVRLARLEKLWNRLEIFHTNAVEVFLEQAQGLKDGGADALWLETISAPEEFVAAAEAFSYVDLPGLEQ